MVRIPQEKKWQSKKVGNTKKSYYFPCEIRAQDRARDRVKLQIIWNPDTVTDKDTKKPSHFLCSIRARDRVKLLII